MDTFYLHQGTRVRIVARWNGHGPRNVMIEYPDGRLVVRPFRGLRKIKEKIQDTETKIERGDA